MGGGRLWFDGKANKLSTLIRGNLGLAMQGLAVVPLFAGYDLARETGRIFSYDVTGGRYEEEEHHTVGSGSLFARGSLKKRWRPGMDAAAAVAGAGGALYDAPGDDSATRGPGQRPQIYPRVPPGSSEGFPRGPGGPPPAGGADGRRGGFAACPGRPARGGRRRAAPRPGPAGRAPAFPAVEEGGSR